MNETLQSWMERAAANPGVLACGVRLADTSTLLRSRRADLPEAQLGQALRELADAIHLLQRNRVAARRIRWVFENGQVHCVAAADGAVAALLVNEETATRQEIERLLSEFPPATGSRGQPSPEGSR